MNTNNITNNIILDNINNSVFKEYRNKYINSNKKEINLYSIYQYYFDKSTEHYFIYVGVNPCNNYNIFHYINIYNKYISFNQARTIELIDNNNLVVDFFSDINDKNYPYESILFKPITISNNIFNQIVNILQIYYPNI